LAVFRILCKHGGNTKPDLATHFVPSRWSSALLELEPLELSALDPQLELAPPSWWTPPQAFVLIIGVSPCATGVCGGGAIGMAVSGSIVITPAK
jgi:hypothetical protein